MVETAFIYFLKDPENPNKGYIGKTDNTKRRFPEHLRSSHKCYRTSWIKSLTARGIKPTLEILDEVPDLEWEFWEREYIHLFRALGFQLVNGNDGGKGGSNPSKETRAKQRAGQLGRKHSLERRAWLSAVKTGIKQSPESNAKRSASESGEKNHFFGKKHKPETLAKLRAVGLARIGQRQRDETGRLV